MWSDSDNTAPLAVMPADTSRSRRRRGCVPAGRVDRDNSNNHVGRVRADVAGRPARCRRAAAFWDATESRGWSPLRATVVVMVVPAGWFTHASLGLSLGFRPEADDCDAHPGRLAVPGDERHAKGLSGRPAHVWSPGTDPDRCLGPRRCRESASARRTGLSRPGCALPSTSLAWRTSMNNLI